MQDVCDSLSGSDVLVPMPGVEGLSETEGSVELNSKSVNLHNMNYIITFFLTNHTIPSIVLCIQVYLMHTGMKRMQTTMNTITINTHICSQNTHNTIHSDTSYSL